MCKYSLSFDVPSKSVVDIYAIAYRTSSAFYGGFVSCAVIFDEERLVVVESFTSVEYFTVRRRQLRRARAAASSESKHSTEHS